MASSFTGSRSGKSLLAAASFRINRNAPFHCGIGKTRERSGDLRHIPQPADVGERDGKRGLAFCTAQNRHGSSNICRFRDSERFGFNVLQARSCGSLLQQSCEDSPLSRKASRAR